MSWTYLMLLVAILFEVIGTTALAATDGFTRLWPSLICVTGYAFAFFFLALTVRTLPVGVVYAVWSGAGIVLIAIAGRIFLSQMLDWPAIIGIALILSGVIVIQLFSESVRH